MAHRTCRLCGIEFSFQPRPGPPPVRCDSDVCKRAYQRDAMRRHRAKALGARPDKTCPECRRPFSVRDVPAEQRQKRYCSYECTRAAHLRRRRDREYQPPPRTCDLCAGQIPYKSGKTRYCSAECQKAGMAREAKWRVKGLDPSTVLPTACRICGTDRHLVIDHDHDCCPGERTCGKCFRGMLCHTHNVALGMFQESPALLRKAARYIENAKRDLQSGQLRLVI